MKKNSLLLIISYNGLRRLTKEKVATAQSKTQQIIELT
jgi:hypothetical protein